MTPAHVATAAPEASDFFFGTVLGQGSYAKVCAVSYALLSSLRSMAAGGKLT